MNFQKRNEELIEKLEKEGILTNKRIKKAFLKFPRHYFVPKPYVKEAYEDLPLPIGRNATISAPHMVAIMLEILDPKEGEKILEIGTGSGWQTAMLSYLVGKKGLVVSVEIDKEVYEFAMRNLKKFDLSNVKVILGDGSLGFEPYSPYDKIIVTAACPFNIPKPLVKQLKNGGVLLAPVEKEFGFQELVKVVKIKDKIEMERLMSVSFVRLKGKHGF